MDWSHLAKDLPSKVHNYGKTEGRIEWTGRKGRRRTQLLDDLKKTSEYRT